MRLPAAECCAEGACATHGFSACGQGRRINGVRPQIADGDFGRTSAVRQSRTP